MTQPVLSQKKVSSFFSSDKVVVTHTKASFKAAIVNMAVNNAISLRFFSTDGFKLLAGEIAEKLQENEFRSLTTIYKLLVR